LLVLRIFFNMKSPTGIGLRSPHFEKIEVSRPELGFFEVISENHMTGFGRHRWIIEKLRPDYDFAFHGVSLNLGSPDDLSQRYLESLKSFISDFQPFIVSDHLCWSGAHSHSWFDLLPLPFTQVVLERIVERISRVQDFLGRRIAIENISTYLQFKTNEMTEVEFTRAILEKADCDLLLDINNVHINSSNHSFDPYSYLKSLPVDRVKQIHLAGHEDRGSFLFDTHDRAVSSSVWKLYEYFVSSFGIRPSLLEWDSEIPSLEEILKEAHKMEISYQRNHEIST